MFAGFVPVISHAAESKSAKQQISEVIPDRIKDTNWVDVGLSGDEFILTLNPDLDALGDIDQEQLKAIIDKVLFYAKNAVKDSLKNNKQFYRDLWAIAHEVYADYKGHGSISATLTDPNLPSELIGYVKAVLLAAHAADIIDANELKAFAVSAKDTFLEYAKLLYDKAYGFADDFITDKVNSVLAAITDAEFENIADMIDTALAALESVKALKDEYNLTNDQLLGLIKNPAETLTDILNDANVKVPPETLEELVNEFKPELEAAFEDELAGKKSAIKAEIEELVNSGADLDSIKGDILAYINEQLAEYNVTVTLAELDAYDIQDWADKLDDIVIVKVTDVEYIKHLRC